MDDHGGIWDSSGWLAKGSKDIGCRTFNCSLVMSAQYLHKSATSIASFWVFVSMF